MFQLLDQDLSDKKVGKQASCVVRRLPQEGGTERSSTLRLSDRQQVRSKNNFLSRSTVMKRSRIFSFLLLAVVVAAGWSCVADAPTGIPSDETLVSSDLLFTPEGGLLRTGILACSPRPYAVDRERIGPRGGTLQIGKHTLVIPAGALETTVLITAEAPSEPNSSVRLSPEGLKFDEDRPARLTLDYSNCPLGGLQVLKRIAYTSERMRIYYYLPSLDDLLNKKISTDLEHFSRYAVAW